MTRFRYLLSGCALLACAAPVAAQYPQSQYPVPLYQPRQYPQRQNRQPQYPQTQYPQSQYPQQQYPQTAYPQSQYQQSPYRQPAYPQQPYANPFGPLSDADQLAQQLRLVASNPTNLFALLNAARLSLKVGDTDAAGALYTRAEQVNPMHPQVKAGMARLLVQSGRPGAALRKFQEAERAGATLNDFGPDRALAYDLVGEQQRAQREYRALQRLSQDDETTRRYALSLGISGLKEPALALLEPLNRNGDRGAWRARAFVLAMNGDRSGAEKIATTMMPPGMGRQLDPFFDRLPRLSATDRAFAVSFGETRPSPTRLADARMVPPLPALSPEPNPFPNARGATEVAVVDDVDDGKKRKKRRKKDKVETARVSRRDRGRDYSIPLPPPPSPTAMQLAALNASRYAPPGVFMPQPTSGRPTVLAPPRDAYRDTPVQIAAAPLSDDEGDEPDYAVNAVSALTGGRRAGTGSIAGPVTGAAARSPSTTALTNAVPPNATASGRAPVTLASTASTPPLVPRLTAPATNTQPGNALTGAQLANAVPAPSTVGSSPVVSTTGGLRRVDSASSAAPSSLTQTTPAPAQIAPTAGALAATGPTIAPSPGNAQPSTSQPAASLPTPGFSEQAGVATTPPTGLAPTIQTPATPSLITSSPTALASNALPTTSQAPGGVTGASPTSVPAANAAAANTAVNTTVAAAPAATPNVTGMAATGTPDAAATLIPAQSTATAAITPATGAPPPPAGHGGDAVLAAILANIKIPEAELGTAPTGQIVAGQATPAQPGTGQPPLTTTGAAPAGPSAAPAPAPQVTAPPTAPPAAAQPRLLANIDKKAEAALPRTPVRVEPKPAGLTAQTLPKKDARGRFVDAAGKPLLDARGRPMGPRAAAAWQADQASAAKDEAGSALPKKDARGRFVDAKGKPLLDDRGRPMGPKAAAAWQAEQASAAKASAALPKRDARGRFVDGKGKPLLDDRGRPMGPKAAAAWQAEQNDAPALAGKDKADPTLPKKDARGRYVDDKGKPLLDARGRPMDIRAARAWQADQKKEAAATKGEPARIWVQVAGGANQASLGREWQRVSASSPSLKGKAGWTTPLKATNRILTGPFKTAAEATALVNKLKKEGVSAFMVNSDAGQKVTRLGGK